MRIVIFLARMALPAFALIIFTPGRFADTQAAADERFKPKAAAHGIHWDYSLVQPYQGAGLRASYAFNGWFAYALGGRTLFRIADEAGTSTRYLISLMPVSQFILRYPVIINNFWRPYFVSELNYLYQVSDGRDTAGLSGRSGIEFFAAQNFAVAIEAGVQLPFYRNTHAVMPQGGIISIVGTWYL